MIRRAPRETGFTVLQNDTLEDERLSWEALGLLSFLLSKPDDWTVSKKHLISCRDAGDHKIKRILGELQDVGYLERQRTQDEEGKFVWESVVYDTPQCDDESIPRKSIDGSSTDGSSIDGKPPDITKTDSNKEGINKHGEESAPAQEESPSSPEKPQSPEELFSELVSIWRSVSSAPPMTRHIEDVLWDWAQEGAIPDLDLFRETLQDDAAAAKQNGKGLSMGILRSEYRDRLEGGKLSPERQDDPNWTIDEEGRKCYMGHPIEDLGPQNLAADLEESKDGARAPEPEVSPHG